MTTLGFEIDLGNIASVLLPDGKWREVIPGTFSLSRYDPLHGEVCPLLKEVGGVCHRAGGFSFTERTAESGVTCLVQTSGPLSSILAFSSQMVKDDEETRKP